MVYSYVTGNSREAKEFISSLAGLIDVIVLADDNSDVEPYTCLVKHFFHFLLTFYEWLGCCTTAVGKNCIRPALTVMAAVWAASTAKRTSRYMG